MVNPILVTNYLMSCSVVILAPPGKHPYEYWMGRFDGQLMWLVDFLANEGFDATRISVFAARNWKCQDKDWREPTEARDELLEALRELDIDGRPVCSLPQATAESADLA